MQLENKITLITGAGAGIGKAIADLFAQEGATVVVSDINEDTGNSTVADIQKKGGDAIFIKANVGDVADVANLFQEIKDRYGRLDVAVNNAGIAGKFVRLPETTEEQFDAIMNVNVKGVWNCLRHELNLMIPHGKGSIINISSVAGLKGAHSLSIYSASKHAVIGFTKTAALEYIKKGIRVNAVCPVFTRTNMVQSFFDVLPQMTDAVINASPANRLGEPEEVAQAVLWLASDASSFTNGLALTVDGGFTIQ